MNKNTLVASAAVVAGLALGAQTVSADTYTVQAGDTVSEIALAHGTTVTAIANLNSLDNQNLIYIGDKLEISNSAVDQLTTAPVKSPAKQPKVQQVQPTQQAPKVTQQVPQAQAQQAPKVKQQQVTKATQQVQQAQSTQQSQPAIQQQSAQPQQSSQSSVMSKTSGKLSQAEINQVAAEMSSRTGESASTWSYIINRESKGNVDVTNYQGSGATGLFQLMKNGQGTVGQQINEAAQLYRKQGIVAWQATAW